MNYVKVCPRCRHRNDEQARICESCDEMLLGVRPEPLQDERLSEDASPAVALRGAGEVIQLDDLANTPEPARPPQPVQKTRGMDTEALTLEFTRGKRVFVIRSGQVLGRDDGTADLGRANIPTDAGIDVGCVSRWHCRFHREDGHWYVTPLHDRRSELAKPNPTWIGSNRLGVSQPYVLRNGDLLRLADVELRVLID